ncbi:hypothetical protein Taro_051806 [Colocasia esculenta]|uniref:Receptor-like serine/threonine-protein kinase n=1 Tax=Colocasia esculenta TaxID=4460 RepID=A0A843XHT3_COLES|nr:hypothetical protein [Colocasia esculenta]
MLTSGSVLRESPPPLYGSAFTKTVTSTTCDTSVSVRFGSNSGHKSRGRRKKEAAAEERRRRTTMGFAWWTSLLLLPCFLAPLCLAVDRLLPGESLLMNQTLVSDGGTFAFGFFTLGASPPRRYLGIWYDSIPRRTIAWVANKEAPFADSPLVVRLSTDSNLEVTNSAGAVLWSTNTTTTTTRLTAVLLGSGNLVLRAAEDDIHWQSFDFPGNTAVPGMTMWFNATTRQGNQFLSWKSADDPAPGDYTMGPDPVTVLQLMIWKRGRPYWRYNPWDGSTFGGLGFLNNVYASYFAIQGSRDTSFNVTYTSSLSVLQRLYLDHNGVFWVLYWSTDSNQWVPLYSTIDTKACEAYGSCGPFGLCNKTSGGTPACSCLPGYEPRVRPEWNRGNHTAGCARLRGDLRCGEEVTFGTVSPMKLPDKMDYLRKVGSERDCEAACRNNCSCTAYSYANRTSTSNTTTVCFVWHGDLIDLVTYRASEPGQSLHLRLGGSSQSSAKREKVIIRFIIVPAVVVLLTVVLIYLMWTSKKTLRGFWKRRNGKETGEGLPLLSFECITSITSHFSDSNMLGEGGFGKVYKGVMPTGVEVAIKRLSEGSSQGQEEFRNEVALIAKLQHRNLVKLLGSCIQGEERILIYEYVKNGSLSAFLFDSMKQVQLDWETRFNIIKGIARGLMYLHQDSRFKIVHRDLKASNILLDEDMNPKISDFGMARMFGGNESRCLTKRVVGTYGYMSPEYAMEGHYSVKSDVYSFGVLILEIVSGRRNVIYYHNQVPLNLLTYAWHMWKEDNLMGFVDSSIARTCSPAEVSRCMHVGLLCVQDHINKRPHMSSVVFMLENDTPIQDKPKKPMFMSEAGVDVGEIPKSGSICPSVNDLSITVVEGR